MFRLSDGEEILRFDAIPECDGHTDRRTDGRTDIPPLAIPAVCISRYANALVKHRTEALNTKYQKSNTEIHSKALHHTRSRAARACYFDQYLMKFNLGLPTTV